MSLVALGPEIIVHAARGSSAMRSMPRGTPSTTCSASTTTTCRSGTSEIARRPPRSSPRSTIVPVSAMAVWQPVSTASIPSSSRGEAVPSSTVTATPGGGLHSGGRPAGTTAEAASPSAAAIAADSSDGVVRCTTAV